MSNGSDEKKDKVDVDDEEPNEKKVKIEGEKMEKKEGRKPEGEIMENKMEGNLPPVFESEPAVR